MSTRDPGRLAALEALADDMEHSANPAEVLVTHELALVRADDPSLAAIVELMSIPRRLDDTVLTVLRDGTDERPSGHVFDLCARHGFLRHSRDGGWNMHDAMRDVLLRHWQSSVKREEFMAVSSRLVSHHEQQLEQAEVYRGHLDGAGSTLVEAEPARHLTIAGRVEDVLILSAREALYHAAQISARALHELLERTSRAVEEDARLLDVVANELERTITLGRLGGWTADVEADLWLRYWDARYHSRLGHEFAATSEQTLRDVVLETGDPVLRQWALAELGTSLEAQERWLPALEAYESERRQLDVDGADLWNASRTHLRLGELYAKLGRDREAEEAFYRAARSAREAGNITVAVDALLSRSEALLELGDRAGAAQVAVEALAHSRSLPARVMSQGGRLHDVLPTHAVVATGFLALTARGDPTVFEAIAAELLVLSRRPEASAWSSICLAQQALTAGMLHRARRETEQARNVAGTSVAVRRSIAFLRGFLLSGGGSAEHAIAVWAEIEGATEDERGELPSWDRLAALGNRAEDLSVVGAYDEAAAACEAAAEGWAQAGHEVHHAQLQIQLATVRTRQGRFAEAAGLLALPEQVLGRSAALSVAHTAARARLDNVRAKDESARDLHREALAQFDRRRDDLAAVEQLRYLCDVETRNGAWSEASATARDLAGRLDVLARRDAWRPVASQQRAAAHYKRGVLLLLDGQGDRREDLGEALQAFQRTLAEEPDHPWYILNRCFAAAEYGDRRCVAADVRRLRELDVEWLSEEWLVSQFGALPGLPQPQPGETLPVTAARATSSAGGLAATLAKMARAWLGRDERPSA